MKTGFSQCDVTTVAHLCCLTPQLSLKDQSIPHSPGTLLGNVDVKAGSILEFNLTYGAAETAQTTKIRNIIHIGEHERHRQPGIYFYPNTMNFAVGWNQDTTDWG